MSFKANCRLIISNAQYRIGRTFILSALLCSALVGCGQGGNAPKLRDEGNYSIVSREVDPPKNIEGTIHRQGRMMISVDGGEPHKVAFHIRQNRVRGPEDVSVEIIDETTGDASAYSVNDEDSTVQIQSTTGNASMAVNLDDTVTVDGTTFPSMIEGAAHLDESGVLDGISDESIAVVHDLLSEGDNIMDGAGRAAAVVVVGYVLWIGTSSVLCTREYRKKNHNLYAMTKYCRDWCVQFYCPW